MWTNDEASPEFPKIAYFVKIRKFGKEYYAGVGYKPSQLPLELAPQPSQLPLYLGLGQFVLTQSACTGYDEAGRCVRALSARQSLEKKRKLEEDAADDADDAVRLVSSTSGVEQHVDARIDVGFHM